MIIMRMEAQRHTKMFMETGEDSSAQAQGPIFGSAKQLVMEKSLALQKIARQHAQWKSPKALNQEPELWAKMDASTIVSSKMEMLVIRLL